jgi:hypothetical protein
MPKQPSQAVLWAGFILITFIVAGAIVNTVLDPFNIKQSSIPTTITLTLKDNYNVPIDGLVVKVEQGYPDNPHQIALLVTDSEGKATFEGYDGEYRCTLYDGSGSVVEQTVVQVKSGTAVILV